MLFLYNLLHCVRSQQLCCFSACAQMTLNPLSRNSAPPEQVFDLPVLSIPPSPETQLSPAFGRFWNFLFGAVWLNQMFPEPTVFITHSPPRYWKGKRRTERQREREGEGEGLCHSLLVKPNTHTERYLESKWASLLQSWSRCSAAEIYFDYKDRRLTHIETHTYSQFLAAHLLLHFLRPSCSFALVDSQRCRGTVAWGTCSPCPPRCSQGACASCRTRRTCPDWRWSRNWPRMAAASCRTTARARRGRARWDTQQQQWCSQKKYRCFYSFPTLK